MFSRMNQASQKSPLENEIVDVIVHAVNLQHVDKNTIGRDTALTAGGLELDSIDILEVVVAIERKFGVKVKDAQTGKTNFMNIGTIAEFVEAQKVGTS